MMSITLVRLHFRLDDAQAEGQPELRRSMIYSFILICMYYILLIIWMDISMAWEIVIDCSWLQLLEQECLVRLLLSLVPLVLLLLLLKHKKRRHNEIISKRWATYLLLFELTLYCSVYISRISSPFSWISLQSSGFSFHNSSLSLFLPPPPLFLTN